MRIWILDDAMSKPRLAQRHWDGTWERMSWQEMEVEAGAILRQAGVEAYRLDQMPWQITVDRYTDRNWAVYVNGELLSVMVYRRGALQVKELLESLAGQLYSCKAGVVG